MRREQKLAANKIYARQPPFPKECDVKNGEALVDNQKCLKKFELQNACSTEVEDPDWRVSRPTEVTLCLGVENK